MNPPAPPLLSLKNVSVRFNQTDILRSVSFTLNRGEFLAIVGPNGAGKTTLIKTILGLNPDYSGTMALDGKPLASFKPREKARYLAYVPQVQVLGEFHRVRDFVLMGRYPYLSAIRPPLPEDEAVVDEALERTGTQELSNRLVASLSGGERQKVMIAAALAQQPEVLILDEPATFLDPKNQLEIQGLLRRINRTQGVTIISITHDMNSALHDATRVLGLKAGQVQLDGPPEAVLTPQQLWALFDAPFLSLVVEGSAQPWLVPDVRLHTALKQAEDAGP
ncbi:ABC transporter ATP-binding protein [Vampirovibrio sp.]|uniref:ABC transporter ATP-binding protein n=1 Tax=Vampirovibrio sp. TaxID=2717857 RepID=UPI00359341FA